MTTLEAILIAVVQGVTELFPVSSLGHAVILPAVLGLPLDERSPDFLPFLVVLHLGTSVALLAYFWRSWVGYAGSVLGLKSARAAADRRLFFLLCLGTLPAVVLGYALEKSFRALFASPVLVAVMLLLNGGLLFFGDRRRRGAGTKTLDELRWLDALVIGGLQCLALVPGFSRSAATMVGGRWRGLSHEDAARFSFLLATPVILGAAVLEIPKVIHQANFTGMMLMAGAVAGVAAYASVVFLLRFFKTHEARGLVPFAYYCWVAGALALAWLLK